MYSTQEESKCKQELLLLSEKAVLIAWYFQNAESIRRKGTSAMFFTDYKSFKSSLLNIQNQPKEKLPVRLFARYCFVDITDCGNPSLRKNKRKKEKTFILFHPLQ